MHDFLNCQAPSRELSWRPGNGSWCLVRVLPEVDEQLRAAKIPVHRARCGSLVAIYQAGSFSSPIATKQNGVEKVEPPTWTPDHLMLVSEAGHNCAVGVQGKDGHVEVKNVMFFVPNPGVVEVKKLSDVRDLPPGRVCDTQWMEAMHNADKPHGHEDKVALPAEVHAAASPLGLKASEMWEAHCAARG